MHVTSCNVFKYTEEQTSLYSYTGGNFNFAFDADTAYRIKCTAADKAGNNTSKDLALTYFRYGEGWSKTYNASSLSFTGGVSLSGSKVLLYKNSSSSRGIQYGPYVKYTNGCYKIKYTGNNLNTTGISFDSTHSNDVTNYNLYHSNVTSTSVFYYIKVSTSNKSDKNVEHRTFTTINKPSTAYLPASAPYLNSITVTYMGDTSFSACSGSYKTTIP